MGTKWERENQEKETKLLTKVFVFFIISGILSGISYFILRDKNKEFKSSVTTLQTQKEKLETDLKDINEQITEKEKSFKEISEKLNQQGK